MLVRCPKCQTTYKVFDDLLRGSAPAFRCSRCKHTFELDSHTTPDAATGREVPAETASAETRKDQELSLPFVPKPEVVPPGTDKIAATEASAVHLKNSATRLAPEAQWSLSDPDRKDEHQFVFPESVRPVESRKAVQAPREFPADDPFFPKAESIDEGDDANNILAISSYREQKASVLPFVTLFVLLIIGFTFMSVISYAKPQAAEAVIKQIPLVGSAVLRNDHLKNGILIQSLRSGYQTIQGNREVFLISGVALNANPEVVREIQLSGVTYKADGKELERQTIWVGNTISPKIIRGMTTEDIPHLQNLKPLKSFEIPPGDSIPFTIVFLKSAKSAGEFSCEVLTAEGAV
ncbi:MAG: zinc-ribbon domain-containing protein [Candidatus Binatia bacterium]